MERDDSNRQASDPVETEAEKTERVLAEIEAETGEPAMVY